jgi:hypothetical protein
VSGGLVGIDWAPWIHSREHSQPSLRPGTRKWVCGDASRFVGLERLTRRCIGGLGFSMIRMSAGWQPGARAGFDLIISAMIKPNVTRVEHRMCFLGPKSPERSRRRSEWVGIRNRPVHSGALRLRLGLFRFLSPKMNLRSVNPPLGLKYFKDEREFIFNQQKISAKSLICSFL